MASANIPHFFSVERKGYTKISELFTDVMSDMIQNGFTLINSSNGYPLKSWKANIANPGTGRKPGEKLYITSGTRPQNPKGITRPVPYVMVKSVTVNGLSSLNPNSTGPVAEFADVVAAYDHPIWEIPPSNPVALWANADGTGTTTTTVNLSEVTISKTDEVITNAPTNFNFTLEASGAMDPLNGTVDPNSSTGAALADADKQPWRIYFDITEEQKVNGSVATKLQMSYDPEVGKVKISQITSDDDGDILDNVGAMGGVQPRGIFSDSDLNQGFYNRKQRVADTPQTYPLSYLLTITDRGFFLGIWEGSWSTVRASVTTKSNYFNWVLVQRPVDRITGKTLTKGKAPVFHINGVNYKYYKAVVREQDVLHPTSGPSGTPGIGNIIVIGSNVANSRMWHIRANADTFSGERVNFLDQTIWQDGVTIYSNVGIPIAKLKSYHSNGAMYSHNVANLATRPGISFAESGGTGYTTGTGPGMEWSYTPPNILALRVLADAHSPDNHMIFNGVEQVALTEDKTYLLSFPHNLTTPRFRYTEELDMIGATSSDVVMTGQDIQFTTYGEWGPRTYRAMPANGSLNTGFRVAALVAPQGPQWVTAAGNLGNISPGDEVQVDLQALKIPDLEGTLEADQRGEITMEVVRGQLPTGITLEYVESEAYTGYRLSGQLETMDIIATTEIKFTIAARNAVSDGDGGYALRDFWFTYVPE